MASNSQFGSPVGSSTKIGEYYHEEGKVEDLSQEEENVDKTIMDITELKTKIDDFERFMRHINNAERKKTDDTMGFLAGSFNNNPEKHKRFLQLYKRH